MLSLPSVESFMNRRKFLLSSSAAALSGGFLIAAEARKQLKITGIETDVLRLPPTPFTGDAIHVSDRPTAAWFCAS